MNITCRVFVVALQRNVRIILFPRTQELIVSGPKINFRKILKKKFVCFDKFNIIINAHAFTRTCLTTEKTNSEEGSKKITSTTEEKVKEASTL